MGNSTGVRRKRTREEIARRAAEARAQQQRRRRRQRLFAVVGSSLGVLAVVAVIVVVAVTSGGDESAGSGKGPRRPAPASVVNAVTGVPASVTDKIGVGTASQLPSRTSDPARASNGHPEVLYVGAEYCPFCAGERWALVQALSRFGTWKNLSLTTSAANEPNPAYRNLESFSFYGAQYRSDYLTFVGKELYTNQPASGNGYQPLEKLTSDEQATFKAGSAQLGFPFLSIGGTWKLDGAVLVPSMLTNLSAQRIATLMSDPTSDVAKAVDGGANVITAGICQVTGGQPGPVCNAPGVVAATRLLKK